MLLKIDFEQHGREFLLSLQREIYSEKFRWQTGLSVRLNNAGEK
jgi:hypothetical protein